MYSSHPVFVMIKSNEHCPICESGKLQPLLIQSETPVHCVVLIHSQQAARNYPSGALDVRACGDCGYALNVAFEPERMHYAEDYEETQGFSSVFSKHQLEMAKQLIADFDLHGQRIVELGCGKGEFLNLLCKLGNNHGLGYDPVFDPTRIQLEDNVRVCREMFTHSHGLGPVDFLACLMTLEHIAEPIAFMAMLRKAIGNQKPVVYFQIPDIQRIYESGAFWDIFYEHCNYFTDAALALTFARAGFEVEQLSRTFSDQYLTITARPGEIPHEVSLEPGSYQWSIERFHAQSVATLNEGQNAIRNCQKSGGRVAIWGTGSKAVALLGMLGTSVDSLHLVDINPNKHGTYLPGTGCEVHNPESLRSLSPNLVIIMNANYEQEISSHLEDWYL